MDLYYESDYLVHHGTKGQKWGVKNGPPYPLSRSRVHKSASTNKAKSKSKNAKKDRKDAVKNRRTISDKELDARISRLKKEQQLKSLTEQDIAPGKSAISAILSDSGKKVAKTIVTGSATYAVKVAMTRHFDIKEAASYVAPKPKNK